MHKLPKRVSASIKWEVDSLGRLWVLILGRIYLVDEGTMMKVGEVEKTTTGFSCSPDLSTLVAFTDLTADTYSVSGEGLTFLAEKHLKPTSAESAWTG